MPRGGNGNTRVSRDFFKRESCCRGCGINISESGTLSEGSFREAHGARVGVAAGKDASGGHRKRARFPGTLAAHALVSVA